MPADEAKWSKVEWGEHSCLCGTILCTVSLLEHPEEPRFRGYCPLMKEP